MIRAVVDHGAFPEMMSLELVDLFLVYLVFFFSRGLAYHKLYAKLCRLPEDLPPILARNTMRR